MLESISIRNIALIDEAFIEFGEGLNVLTGETGAGKSMIIDSLGFTLGEKTSREIIRSGEKKGSVQAVFRVSDGRAAANIGETGIEPDEDGLIIISRVINDSGKSQARINGQPVTAAMLKTITSELIDIHGQHEHQSLLNTSRQLDFVDGFCGSKLAEKKETLESEFGKYTEISSKIAEIEKKAADKESLLEYLEYRVGELEGARLKEGEEEALNDEKKAAASAGKLLAGVGEALQTLYDGDTSASDCVSEALRAIESCAGFDGRLEPIAARLADISCEIDDIAGELRGYIAKIDSDPKVLDEIEERLNQLYIIKKKYGGSIGAALKILEASREEIDKLSGSAFELGRLNSEFEQRKARVLELCGEITALRKNSANEMEGLITAGLRDLNMENAVFRIDFFDAPASHNGADKVEIMFSANKGEDVKPLAKIASGGEMSRVMLAVKSAAASGGSIDTYIFDEIDAGVSGRAAQKVAEKMAVLAAKRQLICVTHLPQIAAMADNHILIEKKTEGESTLTKISELTENETVSELGRLLGGAAITEQTLKSAAEMKELAKQIKRKY